jgi:ion channel
MAAHFSEVMVWSLAYAIVDATPAGADPVYFAFVNYTTLGYGDITPVERWRLLGPITAMNGVILFGWSTAVIFEVLQNREAWRLKASGTASTLVIERLFFLVEGFDAAVGNQPHERRRHIYAKRDPLAHKRQADSADIERHGKLTFEVAPNRHRKLVISFLRRPCRPTKLEKDMAREELKWQNIDADDLPAAVKKSFVAMVEAEAAFKADVEKLLKAEGHMPEDRFLVMSRKGRRLGVAFASTPRGEGGERSLKFKTK